jgi:hypothetical protein
MENLKNLLESVKDKNTFYYTIWCDKTNGIAGVKPDEFFEIWQIEEMNQYIKLLVDNNLNFDLRFQEFNTKEDIIETDIILLGNNHLNK